MIVTGIGHVIVDVTGGNSDTGTEPDFELSAWLVAVTVTVCCDAMLAGAVYKPDVLTPPTPAGLIV